MSGDDGPKTTRWEMVAWTCPRCGFSDDGGKPNIGLQLVDSRDLDIDDIDIWEPEFDPNLYALAKASAPIVYCPDCDTTFDVSFTPREEGESSDE